MAHSTLHILLRKTYHTMEVCGGWCRNVPGLALLLLWIRAASSSRARIRPLAQAVLTSGWAVFSGWVSSPPTEPGSNKQRPCVLLWFCISLSHSSQWADVRRLFAFWSIAVSRLGRKHCMIPENCPNTSKCYILLSLDLLLNLEVIPDLLPYWIFVFIAVWWSWGSLAASVEEEVCHIIKSAKGIQEPWIHFSAQTLVSCTSNQSFNPLALPCIKQRWKLSFSTSPACKSCEDGWQRLLRATFQHSKGWSECLTHTEGL